MIKTFIFLPWALLLWGAWHYIRVVQRLVLNFGTPFGLAFLIFALGVLVVEFFRSTDIGPWHFFSDLFFALVTVGLAAWTLTLVDQLYALTTPDFIIFGMLFADALLSPYNSFHTALRNVVHSL